MHSNNNMITPHVSKVVHNSKNMSVDVLRCFFMCKLMSITCDDFSYQPGQCQVPGQVRQQFESLHHVFHVLIYGAHVESCERLTRKKICEKIWTMGSPVNVASGADQLFLARPCSL